MIIVYAAFCMGLVFSCSKDEPTEVEDSLTKGGDMKDSTEKRGITVNTEWEPDTMVMY